MALTRAGLKVGLKISSSLGTLFAPTRIRGAVVELAWVTARVALYPSGLAKERLPELASLTVTDLPPLKRAFMIHNVEATGTPVLLVHGLIDNRSVFALLRRGLRRRGFGHVASINYSPLTHDVRQAATVLAQRVESLCDQTGHERIHVIGHSLGGLVARYYVQRLGGDERVDTLVTLGSPHGGTLTAHLLPHPLIRQLRPNSPIIQELAEPAPTCRTRFISFYSNLDHLIIPARNAQIDHPDLRAQNIPATGIGHTSLPAHGRVVHQICAMLAHLDHEGVCTPLPHDTPARKGAPAQVTSITAAPDHQRRNSATLSAFTNPEHQQFGSSGTSG